MLPQFEDRLHWYASATEDPGTTDFIGYASTAGAS